MSAAMQLHLNNGLQPKLLTVSGNTSRRRLIRYIKSLPRSVGYQLWVFGPYYILLKQYVAAHRHHISPQSIRSYVDTYKSFSPVLPLITATTNFWSRLLFTDKNDNRQSSKMGSLEPVAMTHFPKASTEFSAKLPLIANENAFLGDIATRYGFHFKI